jgi:phosphoribosylglycinamide formyltransferase-1
VVSNNSKSGALEYARSHGIQAEHISLISCGEDERKYCETLGTILRQARIDLIALAGYMKKLPDSIVDSFENRILNVHPALLPSFGGSSMYGKRVHEAVLARGCKVSGATVHIVTHEYDAGPIVMQQCCEVKEGDTVETLERRVRKVEYEVYPKAIELVASERAIVDNGIVRIS